MSRRGWVLFALMSVIWGIPYLMIKVAVEGVSVPVLVFARTALGALVLLPLAIRAGGLSVIRRHWWLVALFAFFEIMGPWWLLSDAERHLSSSLAGLVIAAVPILGVVLAKLTGDSERLSATRWSGLLVGFAGVALLAAPHIGGGDALSIAEVLLTALGYAIAPLIAVRRLREVPTLHLTAACLSLAALVYTAPAVATWPETMPDGGVLAALAGLGLLCTVVGFIVFFELIREVGASRALVFTYVNPAVAVTAGVLFLDEPLSATIIASFVLILGGSVLATAPSRGPGADPVPAPPARELPA